MILWHDMPESVKRAEYGFADWLKQHVGDNWVLARRTNRIIEKYGSDVITLSRKQYAKLEQEYRATAPHNCVCAFCGKENAR